MTASIIGIDHKINVVQFTSNFMWTREIHSKVLNVYMLQTTELFRNTVGFTYQPALKHLLSAELKLLTQLWF
jgi:hypothetical protein